MGGNIHQDNEDKLKATVKLASGSTIEVTQDTAADLKATVTQEAKDRTITDPCSGTQTNDIKVTMDGEDIDIGDISSGTQSNDVKVTMDGENLDLSTFDTFSSGSVTLTSGETAYLLPSSEQSGRKCLVVFNNAGEDIFIGGSGVSISNGLTLGDGKYLAIAADSNLYATCASSSKTVRVLECK